MQHLEVSGAVRHTHTHTHTHIYIYMTLGDKGLQVYKYCKCSCSLEIGKPAQHRHIKNFPDYMKIYNICKLILNYHIRHLV
jgi:hypothetical protein